MLAEQLELAWGVCLLEIELMEAAARLLLRYAGQDDGRDDYIVEEDLL